MSKKVLDYLPVNIILTGDYKVGKTSIIKKYFNYEGETKEIMMKEIIYDDRKIHLNFIDTMGCETLATKYYEGYRNPSSCILVYDPTNNDSVVNLNGWIAELKRYCPNKGKIPQYLCCNKCDLERTINEEDLKHVLDNWENATKKEEFKVSAKTGEGIEEMISEIIPKAVEEAIRRLKEKGIKIPKRLKSNCTLQ